MNSTLTPPAATNAALTKGASRARLVLVRSEGINTDLTGPEATPQSIGGGPRCSIRLDGPGLRPLHCVITPTNEGAVIRRWAAETRLNGDDFTEASLEAGDTVRVGSVELRIVELQPEGIASKERLDPFTDDAAEALTAVPSSESEHAETEAAETEASEIEPAEVVSSQDDKEPAESLSLEELISEVDEVVLEDELSANSVEEINESEAVEPETVEPETSESATSALDPAIPNHLLQPWSGAESGKPVTQRDTATSAVLLNAFENAESSASPTSPATASPLENEWAIETASSVEEPEPTPVVELADEWCVDTEEPEADVPSSSALSAEASTAVESFANKEFEANVVASEPEDSPVAEAVAATEYEASGVLRSRLTTNRHRTKQLIAALRNERDQVTLWKAAVAEREAALLAAQEQINDASAIEDLTEAMRQAIAEANERLAQLEVERAEALAAAEAAADRAEALAAQLAEQEAIASVHETVEASEACEEQSPLQLDAIPAEASPSEAIIAEVPTVDTPIADSVVPTPETPEAAPVESSLWESETPESAVDTDEPAVEAPAVSEALADSDSAASESLWGIEQLAADDETTPALGTVVEEQGEVEAAQEVSDEPVEPSAAKETPESAWAETALVESDSAEPTEPSIAAESSIEEPASDAEIVEEPAVEEETIDQPASERLAEELGREINDPFAKRESERESEGHEAPASFIEQYAHMLPEEDEHVSSPAPIESPEPAVAELLAEPSAESDGEESIDDYMRKLMGRVRGDSSATNESASPTASQAAVKKASLAKQELPKPAEPVVPIRDLSEMKRGPRLEINTDMRALRKLANQSARHAIGVAATRQSREQATLRLTISVVVIGCSALAAVTTTSLFGLQFVGGIVGVAAGGWFGWRTLRGCQESLQQEEFEAVAAGGSQAS